MFKKFLALLPVNLRLFDGEGAGAGGGAAAPSESAGEGAPAGSPSGQSTAPGKKGDNKPVVMYGKQPESAKAEPAKAEPAKPEGQAANVQKTPEQRTQEYQKFRTEYKDLFDAEAQNIINKRFRETKTLETNLAAMNPIVEILAEKYSTTDMNVLASKVKAESLESLAEAANMTVEQYEETMKLRQENKQLKVKQDSIDAEARLNTRIAKWHEEAAKLAGTPENPGPYPKFNLKAESQNDQFIALLNSGVTVKAAYEVIHMDEILNNTAVTVAKKTEEGVIDNIKARGSRPDENAAKGGASGVIFKADVSKLTKEDRAEIARRAARGENIQF